MSICRALPLASRLLAFGPRRRLSLTHCVRRSPSVLRDEASRVLALTWVNGRTSIHPFTWLKDACLCPACRHPTTLNRRTTFQQLDLSCSPQSVALNDAASEMSIIWNDGHESAYPYGWLLEHCFSNPKKENTFPVKIWGTSHEPRRFEWQDLVKEDSALYEFIITLKTEGVGIVKNAPCNNDGLEKLIEAIGYPWRNPYGEYLDVISKDDPSNIAYTSDYLVPHVDLPYYSEDAGAQFLHCISRTPDVEGGRNQLVDGFFVAEALRREDPEAFELLCETPIHYWDYGTDYLKDFHLQNSEKVIQLDEEGNCSRVVFSAPFRDTKPCVSLEKVELFYHAMKKFENLLSRECIEYNTGEGDIIVANNQRVLHGRTAFRVTGNGMRYVRVAYTTWDVLNSRLRRLQAKLDNVEMG